MKRETKEAIQDALAWAVSTPMTISWRSNQPFPGAGERKSHRRGPTIPDFATHKNWEPGDDTNNIDWVASAQTNMEELVMRLYHEPRDISVVVVADTGPTMRFGSTEVTKHQFVVRLAASILISAEKTHDLVGCVTYPDIDRNSLVMPRPAKSVLNDVLEKVIESGEPEAARKPESSNSRRSVNGLGDALKYLPKTRSLVFVVSDFLNLSKHDKQALRKAARTHYVACLGVQDLRERELPRGFGLYTLRDLSSGETKSIWLNEKNRALYRLNFQTFQRGLVEFFTEARIHYTALSTDNSPQAQKAVRDLFRMHR